MTESTETGIWATDAVSNAVNSYYRYQVKVYHPTTGNIETRLVTDPYSLSLSKNSAYSQVIDLNDSTLNASEGWVGLRSDQPLRKTKIMYFTNHTFVILASAISSEQRA